MKILLRSHMHSLVSLRFRRLTLYDLALHFWPDSSPNSMTAARTPAAAMLGHMKTLMHVLIAMRLDFARTVSPASDSPIFLSYLVLSHLLATARWQRRCCTAISINTPWDEALMFIMVQIIVHLKGRGLNLVEKPSITLILMTPVTSPLASQLMDSLHSKDVKRLHGLSSSSITIYPPTFVSSAMPC
jgi:hypothetical protein